MFLGAGEDAIDQFTFTKGMFFPFGNLERSGARVTGAGLHLPQ
jgi:hypothetical protein